MFSALTGIPTVYKALGGSIVAVGLLIGSYSCGRSAGIDREKIHTLEAEQKQKAAERERDDAVMQRDQARGETAACYEVVERQNDAVREWKRAVEDYQNALTSALAKPPRTVYRDVVVQSHDCTDAVVEVAGELEEALP